MPRVRRMDGSRTCTGGQRDQKANCQKTTHRIFLTFAYFLEVVPTARDPKPHNRAAYHIAGIVPVDASDQSHDVQAAKERAGGPRVAYVAGVA